MTVTLPGDIAECEHLYPLLGVQIIHVVRRFSCIRYQ